MIDHLCEGIGLAAANFLLKEPGSHNLVVLGGRSKETLDKIKAQSPKHVQVIAGDLADFSLGQKAVDIALSSFGQVDALIINHGILGHVARIAECDPDEVRKTFDINFFSAIACVSVTKPDTEPRRTRLNALGFCDSPRTWESSASLRVVATDSL